MQSIYERFGRLQEKFDAESEAHLMTLDLLVKLKTGAIPLDDVVVSATTWAIIPQPKLGPETMQPDPAKQPE